MGGCAGRCTALLMEMDVGSELSPEQPLQRRKTEGRSISPALSAVLRDSFNERGGLSTHDLILEKDGKTMKNCRENGMTERKGMWGDRKEENGQAENERQETRAEERHVDNSGR